MTALALLAFLAAWSLVMGILQIIAAIRLRKSIEHERFGALAVLWIIGIYAIVFGGLLIARGFSVRSRTRHPKLAHQM